MSNDNENEAVEKVMGYRNAGWNPVKIEWDVDCGYITLDNPESGEEIRLTLPTRKSAKMVADIIGCEIQY